MVQGVSSGRTAQQSLFASQSQQAQSSQAAQSSGDGNSSGSVQLEAKISVMKDSLENKEQQTQKLINSSRGVGQNIDTFA